MVSASASVKGVLLVKLQLAQCLCNDVTTRGVFF